MKTSSLAPIALAALLSSACGGGARQLSYGTAQAPTASEQAAADSAQASLAAGTSFSPSDQPTAGGPGLGAELAATLGGQSAPVGRATAAASTALVASLPAGVPATARQAFARSLPAAGGATAVTIDPACVTITESPTAASVVWAGCAVTISESTPSSYDPAHADTVDTTVRIDGRIDWSAAAGTTSWSIREAFSIAEVTWVDAVTAESFSMDGAVGLAGSFTAGAATIVGQSSTSVDMTVRSGGYAFSAGVRTSLDVDVGFQADPFCVTSGTLTLEQVWTRRPAGATAADLPDAGWKFEWSGCGVVTVAHGS